MAITETETTTPPEADEATSTREQPTGIAALFGTGDHKALGRLYIVTSLVFGLGAIFLGVAGRLGDVGGDDPVLGLDSAFQLGTLAQLSLVVLFLVPLFLGLGTYLAPLQVGANTVAFPRAAALAFWAWLAGGATMVAAWLIDGGPGGGGFEAVDLSFLSLGLVVAALLLGSVCLATTITSLRAPGMTLDRVPLFSWGMLVACAAWLLTLPALIGNLLLVDLDWRNAQASFAQEAQGQWMQLVWISLLPQVYVVAIPLLGVVGDAVPAFARVRQNHRGVVLFSVGAFGALAIGAWAQPAQGGVWAESLFVAVNLAIVLPVLACLGAWATAAARGRAEVTSPLALGVVAVLVLLVATLAGALFAVEPLQTQEVSAPSLSIPVGALGQSYLVVGAAVAGGLAALFFWGPKITGRHLHEGLGKLAAPVALLGALAWGVTPMVHAFSAKFTGIEDAVDALTWISIAGAALVALAVVIGLVALAGTLRGEHAVDDAWGVGQTLEWSIPCPPPVGNFAEVAEVTSPEPLLDLTGDDEEAS